MARCPTAKKLNFIRAPTVTSVFPFALCSVILVTCCCSYLANAAQVPNLPAGPTLPTSSVCDTNHCLNNGTCVPDGTASTCRWALLNFVLDNLPTNRSAQRHWVWMRGFRSPATMGLIAYLLLVWCRCLVCYRAESAVTATLCCVVTLVCAWSAIHVCEWATSFACV